MIERRVFPQCAVFAAITVLYTVAFVVYAPMHIQGDGHYTYMWAHSFVYDRDFDLRNDYAKCGDFWDFNQATRRPGRGPYNSWNIGSSLVWMPLLAASHLFTSDSEHNAPFISAGCLGLHAEIAMFGTVLAAIASLWLAYRCARRYVGDTPSLLAVLGVACASPLSYYASYLPSYGHAPSALGVSLFLERWDATRGNHRARRWAWLGVLLGVAMLIRTQDVVIAVAPLLEWIEEARLRIKKKESALLHRHVLHGLLFVACALVVFFPQLWAWKVTYGRFIVSPQGAHYMRWADPSLDGVLFASTGGLLVWTPFLYMSFVGLGFALKQEYRKIGVALALIVLSTIYVNASVWDYWGSNGFSNRRFTSLTFVFVFGAAIAFASLIQMACKHPSRFASIASALCITCFGVWNYASIETIIWKVPSWRENLSPVFWESTFSSISNGVYNQAGNPLAWPASIPFSLIHHAPLSTYDVMRGMGVYYAEFQNRQPRSGEETAKFDEPLRRRYLVEGFSLDKNKTPRPITAAPKARMLIPFFIDEFNFVEVRWKATAFPSSNQPVHVSLSWDQTPIFETDVALVWQTTRIRVPASIRHNGVNELTWNIRGGELTFDWLKAAR